MHYFQPFTCGMNFLSFFSITVCIDSRLKTCLIARSHDGNCLNLKTSGIFFQAFAFVFQIKSVKTDFG